MNLLISRRKRYIRRHASAIAATSLLVGLLGAISIYSPANAQSISQASTQASSTQSPYPILNLGSTGDSVGQLQATLKLLGFYQGAIDGTYSEPTVNAVAQFQLAAGIAADGITGPSTWNALLPAPAAIGTVAAAPVAAPVAATPVANQPQSTAASQSAPLGPPVLRSEANGPAVAQLQRELQELGYYNGPIDGGFGEGTLAAVEQFQRDQQLFVDGVVGQSTWDALSQALDR